MVLKLNPTLFFSWSNGFVIADCRFVPEQNVKIYAGSEADISYIHVYDQLFSEIFEFSDVNFDLCKGLGFNYFELHML